MTQAQQLTDALQQLGIEVLDYEISCVDAVVLDSEVGVVAWTTKEEGPTTSQGSWLKLRLCVATQRATACLLCQEGMVVPSSGADLRYEDLKLGYTFVTVRSAQWVLSRTSQDISVKGVHCFDITGLLLPTG